MPEMLKAVKKWVGSEQVTRKRRECASTRGACLPVPFHSIFSQTLKAVPGPEWGQFDARLKELTKVQSMFRQMEFSLETLIPLCLQLRFSPSKSQFMEHCVRRVLRVSRTER
jgi:hypothetical protein